MASTWAIIDGARIPRGTISLGIGAVTKRYVGSVGAAAVRPSVGASSGGARSAWASCTRCARRPGAGIRPARRRRARTPRPRCAPPFPRTAGPAARCESRAGRTWRDRVGPSEPYFSSRVAFKTFYVTAAVSAPLRRPTAFHFLLARRDGVTPSPALFIRSARPDHGAGGSTMPTPAP
jgi:hypothetical protein